MMQKDAWTWCKRCHALATATMDIVERGKVQDYAMVHCSGDGG